MGLVAKQKILVIRGEKDSGKTRMLTDLIGILFHFAGKQNTEIVRIKGNCFAFFTFGDQHVCVTTGGRTIEEIDAAFNWSADYFFSEWWICELRAGDKELEKEITFDDEAEYIFRNKPKTVFLAAEGEDLEDKMETQNWKETQDLVHYLIENGIPINQDTKKRKI